MKSQQVIEYAAPPVKTNGENLSHRCIPME